MNVFRAILLAAVCGYSLGGHAAPVTVDVWHTAGNGSILWPFGNYSVTGVELTGYTKDGWGNSTTNGYLVIYALGFSDLHGVGYTGQPAGEIGMLPYSGNTSGISLYDFDLGIWSGLSHDVAVRIYNGDYSQLLSQGTVAVGSAHGTYTANVFSLNGFQIQFAASDSYQIGIDNLRLEVGNPQGFNSAAVPAPGILWLLGGGLLLLLRVARWKPA